MKIVIAAWHVKTSNVGVGRYTRELIEAIGRVDHENQYEILTPGRVNGFSPRPNVRYRPIWFPILKRRFWEQLAPLIAGRHDLLHFPYDSRVAWKRAKFITTIHDVKPLLFQSRSGGFNFNRMIERTLIGETRGRVDHILTISKCSKRDIIAHLGFTADRLTVVYPGIDRERFRPPPAGAAARPSGRPYVLCVAGSDPTKNVGVLIDAFSKLPLAVRRRYDVVLVGDFRRRAELRAQVAERGIEAHTVFTGVIPDERLIRFYQHATAFVFPSLYEGFGLPILEAMACGCPVISSNVSALPEAAGNAAVLVDPQDVNGMTSAMERVLTDTEYQALLSKRGIEQASKFPWDRTARETIAVYRKIA